MTQEMMRYPTAKGLAMLENGYLLTALPFAEKGPKRYGWQNRPLTRAECTSLHPSSGLGVLCGVGENPIVALDFDVLDAQVAKRLKEDVLRLLPSATLALCRVGRAPKFALVFRAEREGWHKRSTAVYRKGGQKAQLEVLGKGNQMVAYNIHPDTKRPYEWDVLFGEPTEVSASELPVLTEKDVDEVLEMASRVFTEFGYSKEEGKGTTGQVGSDDDFAWADDSSRPIDGITLEYAEKLIREIKPDFSSGTHNRWIAYGMALHHQFGGAEAACDLWDRLSMEFGADAYREGECQKRWASFGKRGGSSVTFRTIIHWHRAATDPDIGKLTELGLYKRFLYLYGDKVLWVPERGSWYAFDAEKRLWDTERGDFGPRHFILHGLILDDLKKEIEALPASIRDQVEPVYSAIRQKPTVMLEKIMKQLKSNCSLIGHDDSFDVLKGHVLCTNGLVNMETGELQPNRPEYRMRRLIPFAYDPSADCPVWKRTVREILGDKDDVVSFFQKLMGSALGAEISDNYLSILRGFGNNGKSLLLRVMAEAMGGEGKGYAEALGEESLLGKRGFVSGGSSRSDLAKLAGARWVYCAETSQDGQLKEADVKRLTGNDTITCRAPYGKADVNIRPTWRMTLVTNHRPTIKGDDDGVWRRIADIDCPRNFDKDPKIKKDPHLLAKCLEELPGVLNWLIDGYRLYKKEGAELPESVRLSVQEYREEMDDVREWLLTTYERCDTENVDKKFVVTMDLYHEFKSYLELHGVRDVPTANQFVRRIKGLVRIGVIPETTGGKPTIRKCLGGWRLHGFSKRNPTSIDGAPIADDDDFDSIP